MCKKNQARHQNWQKTLTIISETFGQVLILYVSTPICPDTHTWWLSLFVENNTSRLIMLVPSLRTSLDQWMTVCPLLPSHWFYLFLKHIFAHHCKQTSEQTWFDLVFHSEGLKKELVISDKSHITHCENMPELSPTSDKQRFRLSGCFISANMCL